MIIGFAFEQPSYWCDTLALKLQLIGCVEVQLLSSAHSLTSPKIDVAS